MINFRFLQWSALAALLCIPVICGEVKAQNNFVPILQTQGVLEDGDLVIPSDQSLYDEYTFEGHKGDLINVALTSGDFDTYLILFDPNGADIAQNDNFNSDTNSVIEIRLPSDGIYRVFVNASSAEGNGFYTLAISASQNEGQGIVAGTTGVGNLSVDELRERALSRFRAGDYERAIGDYTQVIQTDGGFRCDYFMRGNAQYLLEDYEGAINDYSKSFDVENPREQVCSGVSSGDTYGHLRAEINYNMGNAKFMLGDYEGAIEAYEQALKTKRQFTEALYNKALAHTMLGNEESALSDFEEIFEVYSPTNPMYEGYYRSLKEGRDEFTGTVLSLDASAIGEEGIFPVLLEARWSGYGPPQRPASGSNYDTPSLYYSQGCRAASRGNFTLASSLLQSAKNTFDQLGRTKEANLAQSALNSHPIRCSS